MDGLRDDAWLGAANLAALEHLDTLSGAERAGGAAAFAQRIVEKDALILPFGHGVFPFFMSERIGCGFVQPAMRTLDLLSLCVKDAGPATASPAPSP
jgi:hypothetical protein